MITIGNLILPPELIWVDRFKWSGVYQGSSTTLGGKTIIQSIAAQNGRPITLSASASQGWLTLAQVEALINLSVIPEAHYLFEYHGFSANIVFAHHTPPAVDMEPFVNGEEPSDFHFGTIKLITI